MGSFKEWLLQLEIGQVMEPDKPDMQPLTAVPAYRLDGDDLPPTPATNSRRRNFIKRRMRRIY